MSGCPGIFCCPGAKNMKYILGKKLGMSQMFVNEKAMPVTLIKAGPCYVTQIKIKEKDNYDAVQFGFEKIKKEKKIKKTMNGKPYRYLRETVPENKEIKIGDEINVGIFEKGDKVDISGVSKGKGFAGAVKRWGFVDKAKAHGAKDMRRVGSIGCRFPQRVIKGKKMPGRMGTQRITVKNLEVIEVDQENDILAVRGAVPGNRGVLLEIKERQNGKA